MNIEFVRAATAGKRGDRGDKSTKPKEYAGFIDFGSGDKLGTKRGQSGDTLYMKMNSFNHSLYMPLSCQPQIQFFSVVADYLKPLWI